MAVQPVLCYPHKLLALKSAKIPSFGDEDQKLIEELGCDLRETCEAAGWHALSAPQVGAPYQVIYVARSVAGESLLLVNPIVTWHSERLQHAPEGCLSTPGVNVDLWRWSALRVLARKANGDEFVVNAAGPLAAVLQHEINHLDGKCIIDCANRRKRHYYLDQLGAARGRVVDYGLVAEAP